MIIRTACSFASFAGWIPSLEPMSTTFPQKCRIFITTGFCAERGHLHPRGTGGGPDRKCLLGALLPGAPHRSWRRVSGRCRPTELSWRPVQHFLSYWELRAPRSQSNIRGPGALGGRWAALLDVEFKPGFFLSNVGCWLWRCGDGGIQATGWRWRFYLLFNTG